MFPPLKNEYEVQPPLMQIRCPSSARGVGLPHRPGLCTAVSLTLLAVTCANLPGPVYAQAEATAAEPVDPSAEAVVQEIEEIVVFGRAERLIGTADTASEGSVGGADLSVRPLLRVAELLEVVPGLIAAQHSGSGKANQYFLRGFNLDHGTDFTTYVDGAPWNLRTHGHGQGYLDINALIPDIVERIDYRKGTYRADVGDFSMAGASFISTVDRLDRPFASVETGQYGWRRVAGGGTTQLGAGELSFVGQLKAYDGPWQQPEDLKHISLWSKYVTPTDLGVLKLTLSAYHATWDPTEQIPERAVGTSVCADTFCSLDPTAVGETLRFIGSAQLDGDVWQASAYAQFYDWNMSSNPTYDYQIDQFDKRWTVGGRFERTLMDESMVKVTAGTEVRYDDIGDVGVNHTDAGVFVDNIGKNAVREGSVGVFGEATWTPIADLRVFAGLRGDYYDFKVDALSATSFAGHESDTAVSPKLGLAYALSNRFELYANWGKGFHSNDARGVVNAAAPIPGLSQGTGYEGGARFELGALKLTAAYWWLNLDSELKFVGDSNSVEPFSGSKRSGYEITGFWRPISWLAIDAVYTGSKARFVDNPEGPYIDGSVESAGEIGFSAVKERWEASARLRYLGEYPLLADDSQRSDAETMLNIRLAYRPGPFMIYGEIINVFDRDGKDIVYYYESNVAGVDPPGAAVEGRLSRAEEPRTLRVGIKYDF
jgi:outer membrane receptor protein involved in Fe transport